MILFIWISERGKTYEIRAATASEMGVGGWQLTGKGYERDFWSNGNMLYLNSSIGYTCEHICQISSNHILKICTFTPGKVHLIKTFLHFSFAFVILSQPRFSLKVVKTCLDR